MSNAFKVDAMFDYIDEDGTLLYRVDRQNEPKSFRQRMPDGKGGWVYSLKTLTRRVPFDLRRLMNAARRGETIYVVEGEKDVQNLQCLGLASTTNAQGAKFKWPDYWADFFKGAKRVVVIADNDEPGRAAAAQRAGVIARVCDDTRIINALTGVCDKGDVSDWLAAGGTLPQLEELVAAAPKAKPSKASPEVDAVTPVAISIMEQWRALTHEVIDDGHVDVLTAGAPLQPGCSRSMQCPLPGHSGVEATKPSAWIGAEGTSYIWACDKHEHFSLLPFLVKSGWASDKEDARQKLRYLGYTLPASLAKAFQPKLTPAELKLAVDELLASRNDLGNGRWLVKLFANQMRYNRNMAQWHVWDGKRFRVDHSGAEAEKYGKRSIDAMLRFAIGRSEIHDEKRQSLVKHAARTGSSGAITGMLRLARSEDAVECEADDFDADSWMLNVKNGTIDLRTGELRPHDQTNLITKLINTEFNPAVRSELWESTLLDVFEGDLETVRYVQRAIGYTLTGEVREECFFVPYGSGRNGKGVLLETVEAVLGEYVATTPFSTFLTKRDSGGGNTPELAKLVGSRMVIASEAEEGRTFSRAAIKQLTGGDKVPACAKYAHPFTYKPQFKIWTPTNFLPKADPTDPAFWERVKVVPFNRSFADSPDRTLKTRLKAELQGVLSWCVEGALMWQREGLGTCPAIEAATTAYRADNDQVSQWIAECCVNGADKVATTERLTASYGAWAQANIPNKSDWLPPQSFGRQLGALGYDLDSTKKKRRGIGLLDSGPKEPPY